MRSKFPGFGPEALAFLRSLKRNNRREWFQPRKDVYESSIKAPMLELLGCLNEGFAEFAPKHVTPPQKALFRIYRDTRFSNDKTPYKTHISGIFPLQNSPGKQGGAFYFHFTEKELLVFGGVYTPVPEELLAIRNLIQDRHEELEAILANKTLRKTIGGMQGAQLTRMPKGFSEDHPAATLLRHKQWYLENRLDFGFVTSSKLAVELIRHFQIMAPFVQFLDRQFAPRQAPKKMPFAAF